MSWLNWSESQSSTYQEWQGLWDRTHKTNPGEKVEVIQKYFDLVGKKTGHTLNAKKC